MFIYRSSEYERHSAQSKSKKSTSTDPQANNSVSDPNAYMVLASGFAWNVTKSDVREFFNGLNILCGDIGIDIIKDISMKAYVKFASAIDRIRALDNNKKQIDSRKIQGKNPFFYLFILNCYYFNDLLNFQCNKLIRRII